MFTVEGGLISWCAERYDSTSVNVSVARIMAVKELTTQANLLQALLKDLGEELTSPMMVHTDINAAHDSINTEKICKRLKNLSGYKRNLQVAS